MAIKNDLHGASPIRLFGATAATARRGGGDRTQLPRTLHCVMKVNFEIRSEPSNPYCEVCIREEAPVIIFVTSSLVSVLCIPHSTPVYSLKYL